MGHYDDVIEFLKAQENPRKKRMNRRTKWNQTDIKKLRSKHPGVPKEYLDYLREVGSGAFRECQYMVYGDFVEPDFFFDQETVATLKKKVLCFGDNFSGDPGGFLPEEDWKVVEIWHDALRIDETNQSFGSFIREQMLMDENGNDLRAS